VPFRIIIIEVMIVIFIKTVSGNRLCGLMVRVPGYRSGGPGHYKKKKSIGSGMGSTQPREYN
jgi:hypothetical protein